MMNKIKNLVEKIQNAKSIAICGHKNPDGDSLASALALMEIINLNFGKKSTVIYDGNIPMFLDNIPLRQEVQYYNHIPQDSHFDLFIVVDYGTRSHLGGAEKFVDNANYIIEFDHHLNDDLVGQLCFCDTTKAATGQIIYDVARLAKWELNQNIVDLLSVAIITDTGNFKFVSNSTVFTDMASLVDLGANMRDLMNVLNNSDKKTVLVESKAVANTEFFMKNRLALAIISGADYKKLDGRGDLVLRLLGQIHGVEYAVLLKEQRENQIGISLRSKSVPINKIAESFGGGGHLNAAGAVVMDSLENVREKIINAFKGM